MKVKAYICVSQNEWDSKPIITVLPFDGSVDGNYELIKVQELDVDVPENFSMQGFQIRKLQKEKEKAIQQYQAKIAQIEDQIKKFQCLEMS